MNISESNGTLAANTWTVIQAGTDTLGVDYNFSLQNSDAALATIELAKTALADPQTDPSAAEVYFTEVIGQYDGVSGSNELLGTDRVFMVRASTANVTYNSSGQTGAAS